MRCDISGKTRLIGVIGDPVRHSLSPQIHSHFIEESGLDYVYLAFPVKSRSVGEFFQAAKLLDIAGFNVTMPLKEESFKLVDLVGEQLENAVNTVVNNNSVMTGYNTDAKGFLYSLANTGRNIRGLKAVILGSGGTARTLAKALSGSGADVSVCARNLEKAHSITASNTFLFSNISEACLDADLLVNATPLGMNGFEGFENLDFVDSLPKRALVFDMIYAPRKTQLLSYAESRGLDIQNGLSHLVHQAALSFELFTGVKPDTQTLRDLIREL